MSIKERYEYREHDGTLDSALEIIKWLSSSKLSADRVNVRYEVFNKTTSIFITSRGFRAAPIAIFSRGCLLLGSSGTIKGFTSKDEMIEFIEEMGFEHNES